MNDMKNLKNLRRENLKLINGGTGCDENCPVGPYGLGFPRSCADFQALPKCCEIYVKVSMDCFPQ